ncbi:hypothetical protein H7J77_04945 [Mycolicibacillus parakoreensis]|uniref:hypothetical protein n=1 Tax=Mycolicibacillus parakoreensis TaxID=1069221 RepID=UPI0021F3A1B3|nr:hypothetical protein [Mycolicibacillus parakoreensis]MCV7314885.1 hypothetical protein [Mycolicibacillus parakoreensis]
MAAGAAIMGAGLIIANPASPVLPDVQARAVNLTAVEDLFGDFGTYSQVVTDSLQGSLQGMVNVVIGGNGPSNGLVGMAPMIADALQNGDLLEVVQILNWDLLFDMQGIFQPLFDHTVRGTGEFVNGITGIPGMLFADLGDATGFDPLNNVGDLWSVFSDFGTWKGLANGVMSPEIGVAFQLGESAGAIGEAFSGGEFGTAFGEITDLPGALAEAFFSGYAFSGNDPFSGLLNSGGLLDQLLVRIPEKMFDAVGLEELAAANPLNGVFNADLYGDLFGGLFDGDLLNGLFDGNLFDGAGELVNPSMFTDLFTGDLFGGLGELFDPGMFTELLGGDMLSGLGDLFNPMWFIDMITSMFLG